jgi:hypothetical protein
LDAYLAHPDSGISWADLKRLRAVDRIAEVIWTSGATATPPAAKTEPGSHTICPDRGQAQPKRSSRFHDER